MHRSKPRWRDGAGRATACGNAGAGARPGNAIPAGESVFQRSGNRVRETRQNKNLEPRSDSIGTEEAPGAINRVPASAKFVIRAKAGKRHFDRLEAMMSTILKGLPKG